jgi:hypothetical protein
MTTTPKDMYQQKAKALRRCADGARRHSLIFAQRHRPIMHCLRHRSTITIRSISKTHHMTLPHALMGRAKRQTAAGVCP